MLAIGTAVAYASTWPASMAAVAAASSSNRMMRVVGLASRWRACSENEPRATATRFLSSSAYDLMAEFFGAITTEPVAPYGEENHTDLARSGEMAKVAITRSTR